MNRFLICLGIGLVFQAIATFLAPEVAIGMLAFITTHNRSSTKGVGDDRPN